jgi:hypothetical protein
MISWLKSPRLEERAEAAAKQMRYFRLFSQRGSFDELGASARRAGFDVTHEDGFESHFRWAADADHPDFTFYVLCDDSEAVSVTAESCRGDIHGLVMTSIASEPKISIETKNSLEEYQLGRYADQFRKIMLMFPDFDDGIEAYLSRARVDQPFMPAGFGAGVIPIRTTWNIRRDPYVRKLT